MGCYQLVVEGKDGGRLVLPLESETFRKAWEEAMGPLETIKTPRRAWVEGKSGSFAAVRPLVVDQGGPNQSSPT